MRTRRTLSISSCLWISFALCAMFALVARAAPDAKTHDAKPAAKSAVAASPQPIDEEYTAKIREYTTEPFFTTELVDHLPASATVPTPEKILGYVIGAPNKLTYTRDIDRYLRALAAA